MKEYTAYRSPLRVLAQLGLDSNDLSQASLRLKRKEILLEIQLNDRQTIKIAKAEYTKNDILELFDQFSNIDQLEYHQKIAKNEHLLNFLESNKIPEYQAFVDNIHFDFGDQDNFEAFKRMVSPHLAYSINRAMSSVIAKSNYKRFMLLEPFFELLLLSDFHFAFKKFSYFNTELQAKVVGLSPIDNKFNWEDYRHLDSPALYQLANFVNQVISNFSEKLAISLVNLTVHYQRKPGRKEYLVTLMEYAETLDCSQEVKDVISKNLGAFRRSTEKKVQSFRRKHRLKRWIMLIVGIILGILFIVKVSTFFEDKTTIVSSPTQLSRNNKNKGNDYDFHSDQFREFHKAICIAIQSDSLVKFEGSEQPSFTSPFESFKKNLPARILNVVPITNRTSSDLIIVYYNILGVNSIHLRPFSMSNNGIPVAGEFFIYSGTEWANNLGFGYNHFSEKQERSFSMAFQGHFQNFTPRHLAFLRKRYSVPFGKRSRLIIQETDSAFSIKYNGVIVRGQAI